MINQNLLLGDDGYLIQRSLRFRSSASAYLNRTPGSAGNRRTWTWSGWLKLGEIAASNGTIFSAGTASGETSRFYLRYTGSQFQTGYGSQNLDTTAAVYRDPSAWYHVLLAVDTTQATAANRLKIYVNGTQQTVTTSVSYTQNVDTAVNNTVTHSVARDHIIPGGYFDGYITELNFIDGQALTPSSFGETDAQTGVWKPKKYAGTYGTNGFYLNFSDNSNNTAATIGKDSSGNGNNWTPNNISVTSGSTYDSMLDVPTLTSADAANYCVLNPLASSTVGTVTLTDANLNVSLNRSVSTCWATSTFAIPSSGKWYFEIIQTSVNTGTTPYFQCGLMDITTSRGTASPAVTRSYQLWNGNKTSDAGSTTSSYGNSFALNDVLGVAVDVDNGKIYFAKNNTWQNSGDPVAGTNAAYTDITSSGVQWSAFITANGATTNAGNINFGQRPFAYTPPSGFKALNTFNLPTPTIGATASSQANKYMDATLYTGTGTTAQNIVNAGSFQPDFVWIKSRSNAYYHELFDVIRGVNKPLFSNDTLAEASRTGMTAFNSNGFTVQDNGTTNQGTNATSATFVGWQWKANGSGSSNTSGSITSTVSANTSAGFSIVTYVGTAANATVGHGLGVAPSMIITKNRDSSTAWWVYHSSLGNTKYVVLNTTAAEATSSSAWNNTSPTSTVFSLGAANPSNANQDVAYCFAEVAGYSKFGSYTGNGSSDGPFIYLGFRPAFVVIKRTDSIANWGLFDSKRSGYNSKNDILYPNGSFAEDSGATYPSDFLSNGYKIRDTSFNVNGGTYIYMAFAESPFKYSLAR